MDRAMTALVGRRAGDACEYCRLPQRFSSAPFEIDHVIARKHGGPTHEANLALSCFYCNRYKGSNIAGIDPASGRMVRLYHPRQDRWARHFQWVVRTLVGRSASARATLEVLAINHPDMMAIRMALTEEGVFVPGEGFVTA
jgi:hypothetical protein